MTRWAEAASVARITAADVSKFVLDYICSRFGTPLEILSDRGPGFRADLLDALLKNLSIKHVHSTPYYPQCNGLVEKTNGVLCKIITKHVRDRPQDWDKHLTAALWAYRTSFKVSTQFTPYHLVYGQEALLPIEVELGSLRVLARETTSSKEKLEQRILDLQRLELDREAATDYYITQANKKREQFNNKVKEKKLEEGMLVMRHITSRKDLFCSLDAAPAGKKVTCANNASYPIKGVGKILITISDGSDLCLPDVLYVPGIKKNLLSVSSLAKNGLRVIFEDDRCIVQDRENGYSLITTGTLENGLFVLDRYEKKIQACIAETKTQAMQDAELYHARFGHVGYGSLMTLQRHNMVHDLSLLEMPPRHVCEGCVLGKMHRFAFSQDGSVRATQKLQLVHSDVCGPMRTSSVGNSLYFVTFIDDFSRFCWVYPLKAKSDVFAIFQHYVSMVENETGCKVQTLCTDRGGEYMSGAFKDFLGKKGIKHQCTMPYTPQQNGVAERKNRSLMEMARCMLKAKSLPHKLWMEAVACAAHVLNRCPTCALKTITPYESWYDKKPSVSYLRVFGCLAYAHIPQQLRGKLDDKAVKCIFVGYSSGSKGYRLYNPATNKIFESRDVIFAETTAQPMVAFDVPHIQTQDVFEGFLPSFVENQESQQVDNFDQSFDQHVTPHDVEEIVREEQEVLREERILPKWVQKTLQDSKLDAPLPRKTRADLQNDVASLDASWAIDFLAQKLQEAMGNPALQGVVRTQLQERHLTIHALEENSPLKSKHETSKRGNSNEQTKNISAIGRGQSPPREAKSRKKTQDTREKSLVYDVDSLATSDSNFASKEMTKSSLSITIRWKDIFQFSFLSLL
ncbi:hypothetical protein L7F22_065506 [Adiantum nelumboides]|nr:hypothetical protein [Adiantum nelumboides]